MRKDMARKLVETYREGASWQRRSGKGRGKGTVLNGSVKSLRGPVREDDSAPRRGSIRPRGRTHDRKSPGENLSPLFRYLCAQVGRNWSSVYSELCEGMDRRSAVGGHIFQHLWDYVVPAAEVVVVDGVPHRRRLYGGGLALLEFTGSRRNSWLWEDHQGILRRGVAPKKRPGARPSTALSLGGGEWLCQNPGSKLWFRVTVAWQEYREIDTLEGVVRELVHSPASFPEDLTLPPMDAEEIVMRCKSASKKDLRRVK